MDAIEFYKSKIKSLSDIWSRLDAVRDDTESLAMFEMQHGDAAYAPTYEAMVGKIADLMDDVDGEKDAVQAMVDMHSPPDPPRTKKVRPKWISLSFSAARSMFPEAIEIFTTEELHGSQWSLGDFHASVDSEKQLHLDGPWRATWFADVKEWRYS